MMPLWSDFVGTRGTGLSQNMRWLQYARRVAVQLCAADLPPLSTEICTRCGARSLGRADIANNWISRYIGRGRHIRTPGGCQVQFED